MVEKPNTFSAQPFKMEYSDSRRPPAIGNHLEQDLQAFDRQFQLLTQHIRDVIWMLSPELRFTYISPSVTALSGYTVEEVMALKLEDIFPAASLPQVRVSLAEKLKATTATAENSQIHMLEAQHLRKDGTMVWVEINGRYIRGSDGRVERIVGITRDITERKRAEHALRESEELFRRTFEDAGIGMALSEPGGKFLRVNRLLCEMLGYGREELEGKALGDLSYTEDLDTDLERIERSATDPGPGGWFERRYFRKDGSPVWVLVHSVSILNENGHALHRIWYFKDITQRKDSEDRLRAYQRRLRSLVSRLTTTEQQERRRIASDLHDHLGQLLAMSKVKLGMLQESSGDRGTVEAIAEVRGMLDQAIRYTRSLTFQICPPVLYEAGFEPAVEWLLEEVHGQQGLLTFFEGDGTSKVLNDDLRIILFQAVRELVANVVKHAHAGWVKVSVTGNGKTIRVAVEDNGVGFDVSEATSQTHKRHTFGLFNVRERLEYQGGALDIQSIPGRGTKVVLTARLKS